MNLSRRAFTGIMLAAPLAACQDGQLTQSARDKLSHLIMVARGVNDGVKVALAGYHAACQANPNAKFCTNAIVLGAALALEGGSAIITDALNAAQTALNDAATPDDKINTAINALLDAQTHIEQLIDDFASKQKAELGMVQFAYRPVLTPMQRLSLTPMELRRLELTPNS